MDRQAEALARLEGLTDALVGQVAGARRRYPDADYCARIYFCRPCSGFHGCVAPADDLVDDYPCPACGEPQEPVVPIGRPDLACSAPPPPPRKARRAAARKRR